MSFIYLGSKQSLLSVTCFTLAFKGVGIVYTVSHVFKLNELVIAVPDLYPLQRFQLSLAQMPDFLV